MLAWSVIIVMYKSNGKKYETTRANMSRVTNEGVMIRFKEFTTNLLTVVGLLIENSTDIKKLKSSLEACISISQTPITVASSKPVIYPSLSIFLFFSSILIYNSISHQSIGKRRSTVESYVVNSDGCCVGRSITVKINCT